jgi:hypothetical protein
MTDTLDWSICLNVGADMPNNLPPLSDERIAPSINEQINQLLGNGWKRCNAKLWKAPYGGWFLGPHGAWKAMQDRAARGKV